MVEELHVVDVADDVSELRLGERRPLHTPVTHGLDHPGRMIPEQPGELLEAAAGADDGEVGAERAPIAPDGVATHAIPLDEDPAASDGVAGER